MGVRTWRRMELNGQATVETLINAAIALRCEDRLQLLFPAPVARNMDELLQRQYEEARPIRAGRVRGVKSK